METKVLKRETKVLKRETKRKLFFYLMLAWPVFQFALMYFYVNFSSLILAFQKFELKNGILTSSFCGFENFSFGFKHLASNLNLIKNSVVYCLIHIVVGVGGGTVFSYYIFKDYTGASLFKICLFIPNIVALIIFTTIYKYLCNNAYMSIMRELGSTVTMGLLENPDTGYWILVLFNLLIGFGSTVLMVSGAMSGINESIVESAQLDGVTSVQEFIYIAVPMVFPTLSTFTIVSLTGIFINTINVVGFYDYLNIAPEHLRTYGYQFFLSVQKSAYYDMGGMDVRMTIPQLSALGLTFSVMTYAIVISVKKLLDKFGPSVD